MIKLISGVKTIGIYKIIYNNIPIWIGSSKDLYCRKCKWLGLKSEIRRQFNIPPTDILIFVVIKIFDYNISTEDLRKEEQKTRDQYLETGCKLYNKYKSGNFYVDKKEYDNIYYQEHKEKCKEYQKKRSIEKAKEIKERQAKYYQEHKEHIKAQVKKYQQEHKYNKQF